VEPDNINSDIQAKSSKKYGALFLWLKGRTVTLLYALLVALTIKMIFIDAFKIPTGSMENTLMPGDFIIVNKAAYNIATPKSIPVFNFDLPWFKIIKTGSPKINDVIVFEFPGYITELKAKPKLNYVKRVCGLPGDSVWIINKQLYVNRTFVKLAPSGSHGDTTCKPLGESDPNMFPENMGYNCDNYGPIRVPKKGDVISLDYKNIKNWEMLINREFGKKVISVEGTVINLNGKPIREYTLKRDYYFVMGDNRDNSLDSRYWGFVAENKILGKAMLIYWSWDSDISFKRIKELYLSIKSDRIFKIIK